MPVRKTTTKLYILSISAYFLCLLCLIIPSNLSKKRILRTLEYRVQDILLPDKGELCDVTSMDVLLRDLESIADKLNGHRDLNSGHAIIPVQDLVFEVENAFGEDLCIPFHELPESKKELYLEMGYILDGLEQLSLRQQRIKSESVKPRTIS